MPTGDVFISYSRKDSEIAGRICAALDDVEVNYFIDTSDISACENFPAILADAICDYTLFLFLASKNSYSGKYTMREVTFANDNKPENHVFLYQIDEEKPPRRIRFMFATSNFRNIKDHPIETTLVDDILKLLGKERPEKSEKQPEKPEIRPVRKPKPKVNPSAKDIYRKGADALCHGNCSEGVKLLIEAANGGWGPAMYDLGCLYQYGDCGVSRDLDEAVCWFEKAAISDNPSAKCNLGQIHYEKKDYVAAAKWFDEAAQAGQPNAQYYLGLMYCKSQGVDRDYEQAVRLLRLAAERGHAAAQKSLAILYFNGHGVEQHYPDAADWFQKAADRGNTVALYNLGRMYYQGLGVKQDYSRAAQLYLKAAESGLPDAQYQLGWMLQIGIGIPKDIKQATRWYQEAADQGHPEAVSALDTLSTK